MGTKIGIGIGLKHSVPKTQNIVIDDGGGTEEPVVDEALITESGDKYLLNEDSTYIKLEKSASTSNTTETKTTSKKTTKNYWNF